MTATLSAEEIQRQATLGAFQIIGVEKKRDGSPKAFTVTETKYLESDAAFLKRVLGARKGRSSSILVLNDEAHHAYRRGVTDETDQYALDDETAAANAREATIWIEGLDRINKSLGGRGNGIRLCVDLSATPFYIQGSGNEVGKPFPWVVSDFSLLEAIEAGLVKVPQLPTEDGSGEEVQPVNSSKCCTPASRMPLPGRGCLVTCGLRSVFLHPLKPTSAVICSAI